MAIRLALSILTIGGLLSLSTPTLRAPIDAMQRGDYRAVLVAHPDDPTALDRWIAASIAAHQTDQAMALIQRAASLSGWTVTRRQQWAGLLAERDPAQAIAYEHALLGYAKNGPVEDVPLLRLIIAADFALRDWSDAHAMLNRLISIVPNDAAAYYQRAILSTPRDRQSALTDLGKAMGDPAVQPRAQAASRILSDHPDGASALFPLSLQLIADGQAVQWPLAEYLLNRVVAVSPDNVGALALLGLAQDQQGRDGWPLLAQASARAADDPTVNYAIALHWRLNGDLDAALSALARAELHDPNNPALAAEIGSIYRLRARSADAATWLTLAMRLAPNNPTFWQLLAAFYADDEYTLNGDGLIMIQQAVRNFPNDAELRATLGEALLKTAQPGAAQAELETALRTDPLNMRARYYLAATLEQQGQLSAARSGYQAVLDSATANPTADSAGSNFQLMAERALQRLAGSGG